MGTVVPKNRTLWRDTAWRNRINYTGAPTQAHMRTHVEAHSVPPKWSVLYLVASPPEDLLSTKKISEACELLEQTMVKHLTMS